MMQIQITSTNIRYKGDEVEAVNVHFNSRDPQGTINLNGYVPLTAAEYQGNEAPSKLVQVVREKLIERLALQEESE